MINVQPKISIIMPTYNRSDYICEAIDSALSQTYDNIELIVIDDGSTDDTRNKLEKYNSDERFKCIHQENQGQSIARNKGLSIAEGEFIAFLDSDNIWLPGKLEKQVGIINENPSFDIFYGDCIVINEKGIETSRANMSRYSGNITKYLIKDNYVSMNTTLTRKKCFDEIGGLSGKVRVGDDYELWLRLSTKFRFKYIPEYFVKYRVMDDQISTDKYRRFDSNESVLQAFFKKYPESVTVAEKKRARSYFYIRKARYEISEHFFMRSISNIFNALKHDAWWLGPWRAMVLLLLTVVGLR